MPADSFVRIDANGDGEGTWSNNPNQDDIKSVRIKGNNTLQDFSNWTNQITHTGQEICIVDIGGKCQDDKIPLFKACDFFIIISNNTDESARWKTFGEKHGCTCIAIINSILLGTDSIERETPILLATISGLERGAIKIDSIVIKALADIILVKSNYKPIHHLRLSSIAKKIGATSKWHCSNGSEIICVNIEESDAKPLFKYFCDIYSPNRCFALSEIKVMWVACLAASCLQREVDENILFYDDLDNRYYTPKMIKIHENPQNDLSIEIHEDEDSILWRSKSSKYPFPYRALSNIQLPYVNPNKDLYISGRFHAWLFVSIQMSYSNKRVFIHRPGIGYICTRSTDPDDIGLVSNKYMSFVFPK